MRRFNIASQGRSESPIEYPGSTRRASTPIVQDPQALRSSRRYGPPPRCCSLKVVVALVMEALVVFILWIRHHGSKMKSEKEPKSFVFPVYATPLNVPWRVDDVPFHTRKSLRRSLMAEKPEFSNYISECIEMKLR